MEGTSRSKDYADLLRELNAENADYLVMGAHALAYHGHIRASFDFDVWVRPTEDNARRVYDALARFGAPMDRISVEELASDDLIFQIGIQPARIDIMTSVSGVDFDDAWNRREQSTYMDVPLYVPSLQDLLLNKRASGRDKDLIDVDELRRINPSARAL